MLHNHSGVLLNINVAKSAVSQCTLNMQRILLLRGLFIVGQCIAIAVVIWFLRWHIPTWPMAVVITVELLITIASVARLSFKWQIRNNEIFFQLLVDVVILALIMYFSGGPTNPFITLLLLPLVITVTTLPKAYGWSMAAIIVAFYSGLMEFYIPISFPVNCHYSYAMKMHIWGMWLDFIIIAAIMSYLVKRISDSQRELDQAMAQAREEKILMDRIIEVGALAAGVAHELGTPLATMAVITKDLQRDSSDAQYLSEGLGILYDQLQRCKLILRTMSASTGQAQASSGGPTSIDNFLKNILNQCRNSRSGITIKLRFDESLSAVQIVAEHTLTQAITNLLNNAADETPDHVEVDVHRNDYNIIIDIYDLGHGLPLGIATNPDKPIASIKENGLGLGIFLSTTIITRLGGGVSFSNRQHGGNCTRITLPLASLLMDSN